MLGKESKGKRKIINNKKRLEKGSVTYSGGCTSASIEVWPLGCSRDLTDLAKELFPIAIYSNLFFPFIFLKQAQRK